MATREQKFSSDVKRSSQVLLKIVMCYTKGEIARKQFFKNYLLEMKEQEKIFEQFLNN